MSQSSSVLKINDLLEQVKSLSSSDSLGVEDRAAVQQSLLEALAHAETPYEHLLRLSGSHLTLANVRLGADTGLFKELATSKLSWSVSGLGEKLGVDAGLLGRVLRQLASVGLVAQPEQDGFCSSRMTGALADQALESGVHLLFDIHNRTYQAMPDYYAQVKYREVNDIRSGIFQKAFETEHSCYEYLVFNPKLQGYMQDAMKLQPPGGDWLSVFPLEGLDEMDPERSLFVDIGGGMGQQCMRFRERHPQIPGRVILQDMPITIERIPKPMPNGIEAMAHDIDAPQPIQNAKFYYLRNVLHGLPNDHCIDVLKRIVPAMAEDSRLIIDDIVVPDKGACRQACQLDFIMMASIAGKKRTRAEWYQILKAAGFKVLDCRPYDWPVEDSLIIAQLS